MANYNYKPFELGVVKMSKAMSIWTSPKNSTFKHGEVMNRLQHHRAGVWGDVAADVALQNDEATNTGNEILSVYHLGTVEYWIKTASGHLSTMVMFPSDL